MRKTLEIRPLKNSTVQLFLSRKLCSRKISDRAAYFLHLFFQLDIRIFVRKPAQGKIIFKEKDGLIKTVTR